LSDLKFLTILEMKAQRTLKTSIIVNFLRFPTPPYMTYSGKQNRLTQSKYREETHILVESWKQVGCQSKVRISSRTELPVGIK
jgi:hypothetical protein